MVVIHNVLMKYGETYVQSTHHNIEMLKRIESIYKLFKCKVSEWEMGYLQFNDENNNTNKIPAVRFLITRTSGYSFDTRFKLEFKEIERYEQQ
jgi:hypothetical protein